MSSAPQLAPPDSPNQLTIGQLAAESGMSVRNIRAHQARGLLDPPEVRARVGYYRPEHLEQLRLIRDLQDDGFNLGANKRLVDHTQGTAARLRRFGEALSAVATTERGDTLSLEELGRRFRFSAQEAPEVLAEAERLGVLVPLADGHFRAPSPSLLAIGEEVVSRGISLRSALAVLEDIDRHCDSVSRSFVELFVHEIWKPFAQADMPAERWPEIEHAVARLGPVASEALMAIFQRRLSARLEGAFEEINRRVAERTADPGGEKT